MTGLDLVKLEPIRRVGGWCEMAASPVVRQCIAVQGSEELVDELVGELQLSRCELLLLEAGS
jgi:hypothetical protein